MHVVIKGAAVITHTHTHTGPSVSPICAAAHLCCHWQPPVLEEHVLGQLQRCSLIDGALCSGNESRGVTSVTGFVPLLSD